MSFSIPAAEDIGPPADHLLPGGLLDQQQLQQQPAEPRPAGSQLSFGWNTHHQNNNNLLAKRGPLQTLISSSSSSDGGLGKRQDLVRLTLRPGDRSPLDGAFGDSSSADKRDVVSVSQCCNMMETEDVSTCTYMHACKSQTL